MPAGITYKRTSSGKPVSVTINLKKHGAEIEDFLDKAEMDNHRNEPSRPLEKVIERLDKKHGIKRQR